jgi:transcriptional regulator with XRE-family HTH domain
MDHDSLARQLIRALRGKRSQVALSRRMKCRSNVLYSWESGRRWPTAATFFALAEKCGVDVNQGIAGFLRTLPDDLVDRDYTEPEAVADFLSHLREGTTLVELARKVGTNRVSLARWLKAQAEPRLPELLRVIDHSSLRLLDFLAIFVPPEQLPAAKKAWGILEAQRKVAYSLPWSHAVMRVLELKAYRRLPQHKPGFNVYYVSLDQLQISVWLPEGTSSIQEMPSRIATVGAAPSSMGVQGLGNATFAVMLAGKSKFIVNACPAG